MSPTALRRSAAGARGAAPLGTVPDVSVVTVTHGRRALVLRKAEALARQTLAPERFEWRVLANGDAAAGAALQALRTPFATVVLESAENLPIAAARNRAAAGAGAPLLLMSDDDCLPGPSCLEAHLAAHRAAPGSVVVGALRLPEELRQGARKEPFERPAAVAGRALWINATGANTSLPRAVFEGLGGYDETLVEYGGEDPELAWRLRGEGLRFRHLPGAWAYHVGRVLDDDHKAFLAGRAHYRIYRRYRSAEMGWLLGVHPLMLALKRVWWGGPWRRWLPSALRAYETSYLEGALAERRAASTPGDERGDA